MNSDDRFGCFIAALTIAAFISGFLTGWFSERGDLQSEAIKNGVAEYILDPATGKTTWQWKEKQ